MIHIIAKQQELYRKLKENGIELTYDELFGVNGMGMLDKEDGTWIYIANESDCFVDGDKLDEYEIHVNDLLESWGVQVVY